MKGSKPLLAALGAAMLAAPGVALACASCGSGGDDPMILYPNEQNKFYFGLSRASSFENVDSDGTLSSSGGPQRKETATLSYGHSFSPRAFATLTTPFMRNVLGDDTKTSLGDPSAAARYTAVMQTIAEPLIPQVQLVAGYKYAQSTSIHDSKQLKTLIDVFGNGFSEAKAGADLWYGQSTLKFGAAHTFLLPQPRRFQDMAYTPGRGFRSTVSLGYGWPGMTKTTVGVNREQRTALRIDGVEQEDSEQVNNSAFLTAEWMATPLDTVRCGLSRQAAFALNKNTARSNAVTFAYMKAI